MPTAGQANLRNVTTEFNQGMLADIATLPPTNPIAAQKGALPLTPETSVNLTLGAVLELGRVVVTVDYYAIKIQDRIAFTSRFNLTETDIAALLAVGVIDTRSFTSVRYLSNQQTLKTTGVDLVASLPFEFAGGSSKVTAVGNRLDVALTRFSPRYTSETRRLQIERGRPGPAMWSRGPTPAAASGPVPVLRRVLRRAHEQRQRRVLRRPRLAVRPGSGSAGWASGLVRDWAARNVLDNYPSENPHGEVAGLIYPETSPFACNGAFHYARLRWRM